MKSPRLQLSGSIISGSRHQRLGRTERIFFSILLNIVFLYIVFVTRVADIDTPNKVQGKKGLGTAALRNLWVTNLGSCLERFPCQRSTKIMTDMAAILYSWSVLTHVKWKHGSRSSEFSEVIQRTDHSPSIFSDGTTIWFPF